MRPHLRQTALVAAAAGITALLSIGPGASTEPPGAASGLVPVAAGLSPSADCETLRRSYVDAALPRVGPWGFDQPYLAARDSAAFAADAGAVTNSATGTNVQEAGVDEPDLAKTDGEIVVRVSDRHLVVDDVTGSQPRRLSRLRLPGPWLDRHEVLLVGDTALVVGEQSGYDWHTFVDSAWRVAPTGTVGARTHLTRIDLSDPTTPQVLEHQRIDGSMVAAREYGDGTTRVVVSTGLPQLDFVRPTPARSRREAVRANRAIVREAPVEAWLPGLRRGNGKGRHPLLDCASVLQPERPSGFGTLSVLTFPVSDPSAMTTTAVLAAGSLAYSSADRLYVATIEQSWWDDVVPLDGDGGGRVSDPPSTEVHAFALDAAATGYVASGRVPGTVRDRWSFSEHEGRLRVATALGRGWEPRENSVQVLAEEGDRLRVVGAVDGLGPREQIQSVRWLGDLAVVVTFRQVDPLYTLDLADPERPRVLGKLKIPGFSSYLHPVGGGLLLGLGEDADRDGASTGGQAAVFDLNDPSDVRRADTVALGHWERFSAAWEPRAFTYLPEQRLALAAVDNWNRGGARLLALHVGREGRLTRAGSWDVGRWSGGQARALPLAGDRVALVRGGVRIIDVG